MAAIGGVPAKRRCAGMANGRLRVAHRAGLDRILAKEGDDAGLLPGGVIRLALAGAVFRWTGSRWIRRPVGGEFGERVELAASSPRGSGWGWARSLRRADAQGRLRPLSMIFCRLAFIRLNTFGCLLETSTFSSTSLLRSNRANGGAGLLASL